MFVLEIRYFVNGYIIAIFQFKSYTNYPNLFQKLRFFMEYSFYEQKTDPWKFVPSAYDRTLSKSQSNVEFCIPVFNFISKFCADMDWLILLGLTHGLRN